MPKNILGQDDDELRFSCPKCGSELERETELDYPFVCLNCDENFYEFETLQNITTKELEYLLS